MKASDILEDGTKLQDELLAGCERISQMLGTITKLFEQAEPQARLTLQLCGNWCVTGVGYLMATGDSVFRGTITRAEIRQARRIVQLVNACGGEVHALATKVAAGGVAG